MDDVGRKRVKGGNGLGRLLLALICAVAFALPQSAEARRSKSAHRTHPTEPARQTTPAAPAETDSGESAAFGTSQAGTEDPGLLSLAARGATVIDAFTGVPLFEKNAEGRFFPASSTKILTALLVIEAGDLDREVIIEPVDTQVEPSAIGFKPGERYTRRDMLYCLMLKSANDVAQALARDNAGSIEAFAEKMTRRAQALGATSSHFMNPHGLHNPQHYTTPHDLALIARAAMEQPLFRRIVGTITHPWVTSEGVTVELRNHNRLLGSFAGCTGLKTGYTVPAQQVLVSSALRNNREVISVVMHTDKPGIWEDSKQLLTYGLLHLPKSGPVGAALN